MVTYVEVIEMHIRDAVPEDAAAACEVMRRSISELCSADHHDDPVILGRWLANKTPEIVASGSSILIRTRTAEGRRSARGGKANLPFRQLGAKNPGRVSPQRMRRLH
jgi:hypothetical protein